MPLHVIFVVAFFSSSEHLVQQFQHNRNVSKVVKDNGRNQRLKWATFSMELFMNLNQEIIKVRE